MYRLIFLLAFICFSCSDNIIIDNTIDSKDIVVNIKLNDKLAGLDLDGREVYLSKRNSDIVYSSEIKDSKAIFFSIPISTYDVAFSMKTVNADDGLRFWNLYQSYRLSGSILDFILDSDASTEIDLYVDGFNTSDLLISSIYSTGSGEWINQDNYIDIYNNSDQEIDLSGLCVGVLSDKARLDGGLSFRSIIEIPKLNILASYQNFRIASNADIFYFNNKYGNKQLDVDLRNSDLEVFGYFDGNKAVYKSNNSYDIDNVNIDNANIIFLGDTFWHLNARGSSIILFYPQGNNIEMKNINTSHSDLFLPYDKMYIIDGVDYIDYKVGPSAKRLVNLVDNGFVGIDMNKSAGNIHNRYRIKRRLRNKLILLDTNDSSDDFFTSQALEEK